MAELEREWVARARQAVRARFPDVADVEPSLSTSSRPDGRVLHVLTFRRNVPLEGGGRMAQVVRVTIDETGQVVRVSAAR